MFGDVPLPRNVEDHLIVLQYTTVILTIWLSMV